MLQLQQRTLCHGRCYPPMAPISVLRCKLAAKPKGLPGSNSKRSVVVVHFGRGDEVVAFLPNDGSERTYASTGQDVKLYTMDGRQFSLPIREGITSVGEIRAYVAQKENAPVEKARLAYAGQEFDPAMDFQVFVPKPGIGVMHAMHRMSGGGAAGGAAARSL